jgi:cyclic pyranopterin phosphate synthase
VENKFLSMVNITHKQNSYRIAVASAVVKVSDEKTINAIREKMVPKGDVLECSRVAGLLAVKNTASVIPDCHPLPVEYTAIRHNIDELSIFIEVEVHTIYKTGVEVEAMHGAAITALTMYDMLKPIDKGVAISDIRLVNKKGGKSDRLLQEGMIVKTAVVVCSDTVSAGKEEDLSGKSIMALLEQYGQSALHYSVISDDREIIDQSARQLIAAGYDMILFAGGTGIGPRDNTPDVLKELIDRPIPGIMEQARAYGQSFTPFAMLSRGIAGFSGQTLIITLPGSPKAVIETMHAIFPQVLHVFKVIHGERHQS